MARLRNTRGSFWCDITGDLFSVAILFGENAAAVFLHIKPELAGFGLPFAEASAEVAVEEIDAVEIGGTLTDFDKLIVLLVGRN